MSRNQSWLSVARGSTAAGLGSGEVPTCDTQSRNLVAQGVAVHSQRLCRTRKVALIRFQGGDDELLLELTPCLLQRQSSPDELIDDPNQSTVQILLHRHTNPLYSAERPEYHRTYAPGQATPAARISGVWGPVCRRPTPQTATPGSWPKRPPRPPTARPTRQPSAAEDRPVCRGRW